uniref:Uncharacterized protein n=1 Tax=Sarcophilus harrisii TaxID=9305 RepID=A0A7N4NLM2_SARHA
MTQVKVLGAIISGLIVVLYAFIHRMEEGCLTVYFRQKLIIIIIIISPSRPDYAIMQLFYYPAFLCRQHYKN